jgi:hypothetical protein
MDTRVRLGLVALVLGLVVSTAVAAEEGERAWGLDVGYDYSSIYLFRGVDLLDGEPVHVPRAVFTYGGLTAAYYGYIGKDGEGGPDYEEHDFSLDYTFSIGDKLALTAGAVTYVYPDQESGVDTYELYAIAALDVPLSPKVSFFWDNDEFDSGYGAVSFGHSFELTSRLGLGISAGVGFDFGYNDLDSEGDTNDLLLGVDLPWQVTDRFAVHALYQRSVALSSLDQIGQEDESVLTVGGAFSF